MLNDGIQSSENAFCISATPASNFAEFAGRQERHPQRQHEHGDR